MDSSLSNTTLDDVINAMYHFLRSQDGAVCIEGMLCFVCVEVLRPSQPNGVMSSAVSLPNHTFTGQA